MLHDFFQINDFIKDELPRPNIDDEEKTLAKIVKKQMINRQYVNHNANDSWMTTQKCGNSEDLNVYNKRFLNPFQLETTANENGYLLYKKIECVSWSNARNSESTFDNS